MMNYDWQGLVDGEFTLTPDEWYSNINSFMTCSLNDYKPDRPLFQYSFFPQLDFLEYIVEYDCYQIPLGHVDELF